MAEQKQQSGGKKKARSIALGSGKNTRPSHSCTIIMECMTIGSMIPSPSQSEEIHGNFHFQKNGTVDKKPYTRITLLTR